MECEGVEQTYEETYEEEEATADDQEDGDEREEIVVDGKVEGTAGL